jgi:hypothetical protein
MLGPLFSRAWLSTQILHESSTAPSHMDFHWLVVFDQGRARVAEVCVHCLLPPRRLFLVVRSGCGFFAPVSPARPGTKILRSKHNAMGE